MSEPQPGTIRLALTDNGIDYRVRTAVTQSIEVVRRRVDQLGTTEPLIERQGSSRILVQVPGLGDPQRLKNLLDQTAKLTFQMVDTSTPVSEAESGHLPAGDEILPSADNPKQKYLVERRVLVSGEDLTDAQPGFDQRTNEPIVSFRFDTKGAQRFGQATQQNVGKPFAIVLDNKVISAPVIREPILGGSGQISGSFTPQSANDLAILLRAGALPATLNVVEERTVGPGLGADSIAAGEMASVIGAIAVVVFMIVGYSFLGVLANIALIANLFMIIALLSILGATLTLPGIAGIVLTIGMAVDSNVLIYERITGGAQGRAVDHPGDRRRLQPGAGDHSRRQHHDADRRRRALLSRLRAGSRLRGDAGDRHRHLGLHRLHADALAGGRVGAPAPAEGASEGAHLGACRRCQLQVHGHPAVHLRPVDRPVDRDRRRAFHRQHELRHRLHGRHDGRGPGEGRRRPTSARSARR